MTVKELLDKTKLLFPNEYPREQLVDWLNEAESAIKLQVKKRYGFIETVWEAGQSGYVLPDGIHFDDVESVYLDGKRIAKADFRTYGIWGNQTLIGCKSGRKQTMRIVYLTHHHPFQIKKVSLSGATLSEHEISGLSGMNFTAGEAVQIKDCSLGSGVYSAVVMEAHSDRIVCVGDSFPVGEAEDGVLENVLDNELTVPEPFSKLYREYLLAKIAYYRRDFEEYNNYMTLYRDTFDQYARFMQSHAPTTEHNHLTHAW